MVPSSVWWRAACITALAAAFSAYSASSQTVTGKVMDDLNGVPIAETLVLLLDSTDTAVRVTRSDSLGNWVLLAPANGDYRLVAGRFGYRKTVGPTMHLEDGSPKDVEIRLTPDAVEVEGVEVSATRRFVKLEEVGFYKRRSHSVGYFLDSDEIRDRHPLRLADLLRTLPKPRAISTRGGCPVRYVLDGWIVAFDGPTTVDLLTDLRDVIGLEVYNGAGGVGAPVEYRGPEAYCGVIMIWTR